MVGRALEHGGRRGRRARPTRRSPACPPTSTSASTCRPTGWSSPSARPTAPRGPPSAARTASPSHEQLKIGLAFFGANSFRQAAYDYFRVESQGPCDPPPPCPAATAEAGFTPIWDGRTVDGWRQAGPGTFALVNDGAAEGCRLDSRGGLGLLWYELAQYDEFVLRLQFKTQDDTDNSGVFVRFPNPQADANIPINQGHEIQIREGVEGDGENQKTGSIYNLDREDARAANPAGQWNDYEIRFEDGTYTIRLNNQVVNTFTPTGNQVRNPGPHRHPEPR